MAREFDLAQSAAVRTLIAAPCWLARIALAGTAVAWWTSPVLDAVLVLLHLWACDPIKTLQGADFPSPKRLSSNVVTPLLIASILLVQDLVALAR